MISNLEPRSRGGVPLYQLKITLKGSKPPIWRRVIVRAGTKLDDLHHVIQIAMGWTDDHQHPFITGSGSARTFYGRPDPECAYMMSRMLNEERHTVADLAPAAKRKFIYEYDFGDGWQHDVMLEKFLPPDPAFKHPACLAGANACPPEDCGGIYGYHNLQKIMADPKHPEHEKMKGWIGGKFDVTHFSPEEVNTMLKRLKA